MTNSERLRPHSHHHPLARPPSPTCTEHARNARRYDRFSHTQRLEPAHSLATRAVCRPSAISPSTNHFAGPLPAPCRPPCSASAAAHRLEALSRPHESRNVRNHHQTAGEDALVARPRLLHYLTTKDHVQRARQGAGRHLIRVLLQTHALPIGEHALVSLQRPALAIRASGVAADDRLQANKEMRGQAEGSVSNSNPA